MKCIIAKNDGFVCPAVNSDGECTVFTDEGVVAKERHGICNYKEIRRPTAKVEEKRTRMGQQKQAKKKVNVR